jgi:hypothetical protein
MKGEGMVTGPEVSLIRQNGDDLLQIRSYYAWQLQANIKRLELKEE